MDSSCIKLFIVLAEVLYLEVEYLEEGRKIYDQREIQELSDVEWLSSLLFS
jgi:hypothetical protein